LFSIHRDAACQEEVISNQGIFEEFLLGHKVKQRFERKADNRDIRPVLVFGQNNHGPAIRKSLLPFDLNLIENGENQAGHSFRDGIDKGVSFHSHF
jgi:hypothetical protein